MGAEDRGKGEAWSERFRHVGKKDVPTSSEDRREGRQSEERLRRESESN